MGYAGGTTPAPTYQQLGDHVESFQVDYDPAAISYDQLLAVFWESHDGRALPYSRQYASFIFYTNDEQKTKAQAFLAREQARDPLPIRTELVPLVQFFRAEDYHQKYALQSQGAVARELMAIYPDPRAFADSPAAARLNGYLGGHGSRERLLAELPGLGLSAPLAARLAKTLAPRLEAGGGSLPCPLPEAMR